MYDWQSILDIWLGPDSPASPSRRPGASHVQITEVEQHLGLALPPSYRSFLQASNGCLMGEDGFVEELWPIEKIDWFHKREPEWVEAYTATLPLVMSVPSVSNLEYFVYGDGQDPVIFRAEYLRLALEISPVGDSAVYLLNPNVIDSEGEWEAWFFANWLPGVNRYRSFVEMIIEEYELG